MLTIIFDTGFHMHRFNGQLVIAVKIKGKENFHMAAMLFYILQKIILTEVAYFSVICYHAQFQDSVYVLCSYQL
jgi:hypothetical protein